jgi:hypothetical protein
MKLYELLQTINEHLEAHPEDYNLEVSVAGIPLKLEPQWYPEDGYVRIGSFPTLHR